jgi:hypothetical protein
MLVRWLARRTVQSTRRRGKDGKRVSVCVKRDVLFERGSVAAFVVTWWSSWQSRWRPVRKEVARGTERRCSAHGQAPESLAAQWKCRGLCEQTVMVVAGGCLHGVHWQPVGQGCWQLLCGISRTVCLACTFCGKSRSTLSIPEDCVAWIGDEWRSCRSRLFDAIVSARKVKVKRYCYNRLDRYEIKGFLTFIALKWLVKV